MIKSKELAKRLGVSEATISLVLNNKPGISAKTRNRVIQEIRELGYGNLLEERNNGENAGYAADAPTGKNAANQKTGSGKNLGFILYRETGKLLGMNSFFPLILDGIEMTARRYGYSLSILNMDKVNLSGQLSFISEANCVGYVIFATELHEQELLLFEKTGIPFVVFDNYFIEHQLDSVKVNNEQGTWIGVKYLREMGHEKIGYLSSGCLINSFTERKECAIKAMKLLGAVTPEKYVFEVGYPHEEAEIGMNRVLDGISSDDLPTAFMADNDLVVAGAMRAFQRRGFRVPEDISFVGFDDRPICTILQPQLTTIRLPRDIFGAEAVETLIRKIENIGKGSTKTEINGKLICRESVQNRNQL